MPGVAGGGGARIGAGQRACLLVHGGSAWPGVAAIHGMIHGSALPLDPRFGGRLVLGSDVQHGGADEHATLVRVDADRLG